MPIKGVRMSNNAKRLMNSYTRGIAKSMDFNNKIHTLKKNKTVTVHSVWQDIGVELVLVMESYSKEKNLVKYAK